MKILHTSDWHLGQNFFTKSRKSEHQAFILWLLEVIEAQAVDAVIIAGDVFDTGTPPSYAREMYNKFVVDLHALGCSLVVLGGNHDSVSVLNESKPLLACLNTYVVASTGMALEEQLIEIPARNGEVGAIICAVPYIRPRDVLQSQAGESGLEKRQALGDGIKQHYAMLYDMAKKRRQALGLAIPIIATGHLSALGVSQSESVRDIYIGSLDGFDAKGFPPADYIALGHIHKPQIVAKSEHIRYSGSPIPLSFDEIKSQKQVVLVEFDGTTSDVPLKPKLTPLDIPVFRMMHVLKGNLDELEAALQQVQISNDDEPAWLCIEVETQDYLSDLQQRIQTMCEGLNVDVLQLRRAKNKNRQLLNQAQQETLAELKPEDVFDKRLAMEGFDTDEEQARLNRIRLTFGQVLSEVQHKEVDA